MSPKANFTDTSENNNTRKDSGRCPYCHRQFQSVEELTLHLVTRHTQIGTKRGPAQAGGEK